MKNRREGTRLSTHSLPFHLKDKDPLVIPKNQHQYLPAYMLFYPYKNSHDLHPQYFLMQAS